MATTLPPSGPLNLDAGLQKPHFQDQEAKESNVPTLYGHDGEIEDARLLTPCSLDTPIEELRRRYWQDGVIWVKGLLDPDLVNDFRAAYFSMMDEGTNMLKPGSDPRDGIFNPDTDWRDFTSLTRGHSSRTPSIHTTRADTKNSRILSGNASSRGEITPVHYDQIFLRVGPPTSVTAWIPIGDVEVEGGGLIYLDRAHDIGVKYEEDFSKMNAGLSDKERMSAFNKNMERGGWLDKNTARFGNQWSRTWLVGAYEAGDVVFHTPYTIHAGAKNRSPKGRLRLSTDLQFVDKTKPYDERWKFLAFSENDPNVARKTALRKQA
ncbi:hypothetical protein NCS52_01186800 [Fusarium sp. LHS14.1]|nr:hypothetical protein NCS52_01186800 [Fusarium sp. LHS14.1]